MAIEDAVRTIVENLVTHPADVEVSSEDLSDNGSKVKIKIHVNPEDRGRVIGRQGKTINALRTVIKAAAVKTNQRVNIKVIEEDDSEVSPMAEDKEE